MKRAQPSERVAAIIQARMNSTRLPGKVLMPLAGRPVLQHVVERSRAARLVDAVVVATTNNPADDAIAALTHSLGAAVYRGSEDDVLGRYANAARAAHASIVVRVTADCPLLDSDLLTAMIERMANGDRRSLSPDLVSNARLRTFPRGLDLEVFTRAALDAAATEATAPHQREHVTPFLYEHAERFHIVDHVAASDDSRYRLTLDTPEDYALLGKLFDAMNGAPPSTPHVLALLRAHPEWVGLNAHVRQKPVLADSPRV